MFCPNCKAEYRVGFTICADCNVPLVDHLINEEKAPDLDAGKRFVKILETTDLTDVIQIKSLLEGQDIRYFIQGDVMNTVYSFIQPAVLMVMEDDVEKTLALLKDVKLNYYRMIFSKNA